MPRVVALPRAEEVDGGQVCAGGLKRGGQHGVVRDVHVQDDRDRARGSANMRQNRAASSGSSSPSPCPAAVLRLILRPFCGGGGICARYTRTKIGPKRIKF